MRKYWHVINLGIQNNLTYRFNFLARALFGLVPLVAMLYVWKSIYADKGSGGMVGPYGFAEMVSYYIDPEACQACLICLKTCSTNAIDGAKHQIHVIDQTKCHKCGECLEACPPHFGAVIKFSGRPVPEPLPAEQRTVVRKKKAK